VVGTYIYHCAVKDYLWLGNSTPASSSGCLFSQLK